MHIDDRAQHIIDLNKERLKEFSYINDINFVDARTVDVEEMLTSLGVNLDSWNPYVGKMRPPLKGELGIWASTINIWNYVIDKNLDSILVIEDDAELVVDAPNIIRSLVEELPENWDFLSLYFDPAQNMFDETTDIGAKNIHKSINQHAQTQGMLYSNSGCKKLLNLLYEKGLEYTIDCFMYEQVRIADLNGYSIKPNSVDLIINHGFTIGSQIDPDNLRNTFYN